MSCTADGWPGGHHSSLFLTQGLHTLPLVKLKAIALELGVHMSSIHRVIEKQKAKVCLSLSHQILG